MRNDPTFTWWGESYTLLDHPYNTTAKNERAVEIPIAQRWVSEREGDGLEVGNVLGHYGPMPKRRIIDKGERGPGIDSIDIREAEGSYDWIVSVSTIEHVGESRDERGAMIFEPDGGLDAIVTMLRMLNNGGLMLVTIPTGWNPMLDFDLMSSGYPFDEVDKYCTFVREVDSWVQNFDPKLRAYGPQGNGVWIVEWDGL